MRNHAILCNIDDEAMESALIIGGKFPQQEDASVLESQSPETSDRRGTWELVLLVELGIYVSLIGHDRAIRPEPDPLDRECTGPVHLRLNGAKVEHVLFRRLVGRREAGAALRPIISVPGFYVE